MGSTQPEYEPSLLRSLSPAFFSTEGLTDTLIEFLAQDLSRYNMAIFDTHTIREEILHNVDNLLDKYTQNWPDTSQIQRDLMWAALQLTLRIQALRDEVGPVADPTNDAPMAMTELRQRMTQLQSCHDLLVKANASETAGQIKSLEEKFGESVAEDSVARETSFAALVNEIDTRNKLRLFWVWGRATLDLVFNYTQATDASHRLADSSYLPGQISWSLYLFRGSLFFGHWLKSRKTPAWIEKLPDAEKAIYLAKHHKACWDIYKYRIYNDVVWGPINLACFAWWMGTGFYGWLGDASTVFLLGMDVFLAEVKKAESFKKNNDISDQYKTDYLSISQTIYKPLANYKPQNAEEHKALKTIENNADSKEVIEALDQFFLNNLNQPRVHSFSAESRIRIPTESGVQGPNIDSLIKDFHLIHEAQKDFAQRAARQAQQLDYDRYYAWILLLAFMVSVAFLMPGVFPLAITAGLKASGTILCMALTILERTLKAQAEIAYHGRIKTDLEDKATSYLEKFKGLTASNDSIALYRKTLYQRMSQLMTESYYEKDLISYQHWSLLRNTLLRIVVPTLLGLTLVYAPASLCAIPTYLVVLALSALLAYVLERAIAIKKRDKPQILAFDEDTYQKFKTTPHLDFFKQDPMQSPPASTRNGAVHNALNRV